MTGLKGVTEKNPLLTSLLCQKHRLVEVILNRNALAWKDTDIRKPANGTVSELGTATYHVVQTCEIVSVHEAQPNADGNRKISKIDLQQHTLYLHAFTVFYVKRAGQHKWRCSDITFHCTNQGLCQQWVQTIDKQLSLLSNRPRSLLVYINPYGGKGLGKQIYERKVAPLFQRASISADVIVTEHANHAKDHLRKEADLEKYDGVVCVGGDGMFSEVLHGLVAWTQTHHGVDQNRMDAELVPCSLRIGIIPAGSTDCVCFATVGTSDPITSTLHIILGDSQPLDVCSVHHNNTILKYSTSLLGYGFYGDVLTDSERKRWLGPGRYDLAGIKAFLSHNHYEGTISFLPVENSRGNPRDKLLCRAGCRVCQHQSSETAVKTEHSDKASGGVWHDISGKFVAINAASMSCACPRSPKGLSPSAHLADGTTDLILVRQCTRFDFLRHLVRHTNEEDQFDHPFIEVHRVRRFSFQPKFQEAISIEDHSETKTKLLGPICSAGQACKSSTVLSSWTCDGEILPHAAIHVSVQPQLIRLFARGIEDKQE